MKKYRRKLYEVDAIQWDGANAAVIAGLLPEYDVSVKKSELSIARKDKTGKTLDTVFTASKSDYIILEGSLPRGYVPPYRVGEGVFKMMYEEIT